MKPRHVTIKDVAKAAGVSTATVSLALSGDNRVNVKTRRLVESIAKQLSYVPNEIGRSLRSRRAETVAMIFPNTAHDAITHPYFIPLLEGVMQVLVERGLHLMLSTAPNAEDETGAYEKILKNRRADGIILWPSSMEDRNIDRILVSSFPLVYLGSPPYENVATARRDEEGGAYLATQHLIVRGRRHVAHVSGMAGYQVSIARQQGYRQALEEAGIAFDSRLVVQGDFTMESGYEGVRRLIAAGVVVDGVFAANDSMAIGSMKALAELGRRIPEDVAVVGFDNVQLAEVVTPPLTTINHSMKEVGITAAEKLVAMLDGGSVELDTVIPSQLIQRQSS